MRNRGALMLAAAIVLVAIPERAPGADKTGGGAAVGAEVGLITGGVSGAAKGALVGGAAGALSEKGDKTKTKKYATNAAIARAGVGLLTDGISGAAKGAVYAGSAGAIVGHAKDKKNQH
jgi:hypothetical protein